jgi:integrase
MKRELNDRYLKSLKPAPDRRLEVSDTKRVGLRFRLSPVGKATWMYEKRVKGGMKRKHTLGAWPEPISLSTARAMALEIEAEAAKGVDRVALSKARKIASDAEKSQTLSVKQVLEIYDKLHLSNLRRGKERKRQIEQSLSSKLEDPMGALSKADLQKPIDEKASEGKGVFANRIRAALMAFTRWATDRDYLKVDVGARLNKPLKEVNRERSPTIAEVRAIWKATFSMGDLWGPSLRLMILTLQRRQEVLGLEWPEVDLVSARIVKPGSKTKNGKEYITHLSAPALQELKSLKEKVTKSHLTAPELVFTTTGTTPISGVSKAKLRLDKALGDSVAPWRLHDLRSSFATTMVESGVAEAIADRVLNHSAVGSAPSAVARIYNQAEMLPQRANALDQWAHLVTHNNSEPI